MKKLLKEMPLLVWLFVANLLNIGWIWHLDPNSFNCTLFVFISFVAPIGMWLFGYSQGRAEEAGENLKQWQQYLELK